jgi:hypothetical protein
MKLTAVVLLFFFVLSLQPVYADGCEDNNGKITINGTPQPSLINCPITFQDKQTSHTVHVNINNQAQPQPTHSPTIVTVIVTATPQPTVIPTVIYKVIYRTITPTATPTQEPTATPSATSTPTPPKTQKTKIGSSADLGNRVCLL